MENQLLAWTCSMTAMAEISEDSIKGIEREALELGKNFETTSESLKRREEFMRYISDTSDEAKTQYEAFKHKEEAFEKAYEGYKHLMTLLREC